MDAGGTRRLVGGGMARVCERWDRAGLVAADDPGVCASAGCVGEERNRMVGSRLREGVGWELGGAAGDWFAGASAWVSGWDAGRGARRHASPPTRRSA